MYTGGDHDGEFRGQRYFRARPGHGVMVPASDVEALNVTNEASVMLARLFGRKKKKKSRQAPLRPSPPPQSLPVPVGAAARLSKIRPPSRRVSTSSSEGPSEGRGDWCYPPSFKENATSVKSPLQARLEK